MTDIFTILFNVLVTIIEFFYNFFITGLPDIEL